MQLQIVEAIVAERRHQDRKWGNRPRDVGAWLLLAQLELAEAQLAWAKSPLDDDALIELVQVAALAVACLEQHGVAWTAARWGRNLAAESGAIQMPQGVERLVWLELMAIAVDRYLTTGEGRADLEQLRDEEPGR